MKERSSSSLLRHGDSQFIPQKTEKDHERKQISLNHNTAFIYIYIYIFFADRASQYIYRNINQLDALNFIMSLFHASTCFEHINSL